MVVLLATDRLSSKEGEEGFVITEMLLVDQIGMKRIDFLEEGTMVAEMEAGEEVGERVGNGPAGKLFLLPLLPCLPPDPSSTLHHALFLLT